MDPWKRFPLVASSVIIAFAVHSQAAGATSMSVTFSQVGVGDLATSVVNATLPGDEIGFWTASQHTDFIDPKLDGVPIDTQIVVGTWGDVRDPFLLQHDQTWSATGSSVLHAEQNAYGARISPFPVNQPYTFESNFDPVDSDNDYVGLIVGYLDDDNLVYVLWGGTVDARIVEKQNGIDTILADQITPPWVPGSSTIYGIRVVVPEPGTFPLMGIGLVAIARGARRGRRRRGQAV